MSNVMPRLGDRSLFPTLLPAIYLNHAAVSPPSTPVLAAVRQVIDSYAQHGMGTVMRWVEQRQALKTRLAQLLGTVPEQLGLIANTTTGVIDIAMCLPWRTGDEIVVFRGEFPTNVTPWQQAGRRHGLTVHEHSLAGFGDHSGAGLQALEERLRGVLLGVIEELHRLFYSGLVIRSHRGHDLDQRCVRAATGRRCDAQGRNTKER